MRRATAYAALAEELRRWAELPAAELVGRVNRPPEVRGVAVEGEIITIELSASWADDKHASVRVEAVANGPSHWRMERLIERLVVPLPEQRS